MRASGACRLLLPLPFIRALEAFPRKRPGRIHLKGLGEGP